MSLQDWLDEELLVLKEMHEVFFLENQRILLENIHFSWNQVLR